MLNMVVTKENYIHMPLLVEYANEIRIKYLDFTLLNIAAVTEENSSYYYFYKSSEFLKVLSLLEEKIKTYTSVTVTNKIFKTDNSFQKCPFPWTHFYICWDGFIPPCCAKPFPKELNFGNVFNSSVMEVLNSEDYRKFRELWFENQTPNFCNKCHYIGLEPIKV